MKKFVAIFFLSILSVFGQTNQELLNHIQKLEKTIQSYDKELKTVKKQMSHIKAVHSESIDHYIKEELKKHLSKQKSLLSLFRF